jgi:hypothetical protein
MSPDQLAYYRERALIERRRASEATNTVAANIHVKLAECYEQLVELEELDAPSQRTVELGFPPEFDTAKLGRLSDHPLFSPSK